MIVETHGKAFVGDYIGEFNPGSLFLIGPHLPHNWITDELGDLHSIDLRDMLVQFNLNSIEKLKSVFPEFHELDELLARSIVGIEFLHFEKSLAQFHLTEIRDATGSDRILKFLSFLLTVSKHPHQKSLSIANVAHRNFKAEHNNISRIIDYIIVNFAEDICLEKTANMSNMSVTAFSRNFQKLTGSRFSEFVTRVRIGQACSMLQGTDKKIATICHESGFRNLANFNRHFLRIKDTTPSNYRNLTRRELHSPYASN